MIKLSFQQLSQPLVCSVFVNMALFILNTHSMLSHGLDSSSLHNIYRLFNWEFLQAGCHSHHQTNKVKSVISKQYNYTMLKYIHYLECRSKQPWLSG